ncbi:MrcB family domain-containing protein [Streptomyces sp. URMC 127]|uniref:MrcB family domain-containing protein n=1 Tax=Streptomyces sp. URMC 127 TaxID=3423402 RepID=UPI003F19748E
MGIRDLLSAIGATYDKSLGTKEAVPAQALLRDVGQHLASAVPVGYKTEGHGGNGNAAETPWIGVFDSRLTEDPKAGLYIAYIFAADLKSVTLTLQQGVTGLSATLGEGKRRRSYLENRAKVLLAGLPAELVAGWDVRPDFKSKIAGPLSYEAGSVVARPYDVAAMPSEAALREDLWHMTELLQLTAAVEEKLAVEGASGRLQVSYAAKEYHARAKKLDGFRPKDSGDYVAHIPERTIKKTRDHENLINRFEAYITQRGFTASTEHPKDMVLRKGDHEWLVEAKTVKRGNPTSAVREAVGQLFEYSHFLYGGDADEGGNATKPHLLGLFTEDIKAYGSYLESLGIASVWMTAEGWQGSPSAVSAGLVD